MGISVPTTNLKKYDYIYLDYTLGDNFAAAYVHYLFLQNVDFSDIDELWVMVDHVAPGATNSNITLDIDRTTVLWDDDSTGGARSHVWDTIDVSSYSGVRELGLLWDITGAFPAAVNIYFLKVWGKKATV